MTNLAGAVPSGTCAHTHTHTHTYTHAQEVLDLFIPSYNIKDPEAKAQARAEVCAGPMQAKLAKLSELLVC